MLKARLVLMLAILAMAASGLTDFFVVVFGPFKYVMTIVHFSAPCCCSWRPGCTAGGWARSSSAGPSA